MIRISVVIPTYNRRAVLERTLAAVLAQEFAADAYEVVVAVDGATDGTVEMLRALKSACALQVLELPLVLETEVARTLAVAEAPELPPPPDPLFLSTLRLRV